MSAEKDAGGVSGEVRCEVFARDAGETPTKRRKRRFSRDEKAEKTRLNGEKGDLVGMKKQRNPD